MMRLSKYSTLFYLNYLTNSVDIILAKTTLDITEFAFEALLK